MHSFPSRSNRKTSDHPVMPSDRQTLLRKAHNATQTWTCGEIDAPCSFRRRHSTLPGPGNSFLYVIKQIARHSFYVRRRVFVARGENSRHAARRAAAPSIDGHGGIRATRPQTSITDFRRLNQLARMRQSLYPLRHNALSGNGMGRTNPGTACIKAYGTFLDCRCRCVYGSAIAQRI